MRRMVASLRVSEALVVCALQPPATSRRAAQSAKLIFRIAAEKVCIVHLEESIFLHPCSASARTESAAGIFEFTSDAGGKHAWETPCVSRTRAAVETGKARFASLNLR